MRTPVALRLLPLVGLLTLASTASPAATADVPRAQVHHDLAVTIDPDASTLEAADVLTFPLGLDHLAHTPSGGLEVTLHAGLELASADPAWTVLPLAEKKATGGEEAAPDDLKLRAWELRPASGAWPKDAAPRLRWKGKILHPPVAETENYGRNFARSPGTIGPEGVVLTRATWWVPHLGEDLVSFRLAVDLPAGWDAVSQGKRAEHKVEAKATHVVWDCVHPMEEIYLIASRFTVYERPAGGFDALAYLRKPDPALAAKYLEATAQYVDMYRRLIAPYPFEKFALVENFWETGYGMPSFTLLGSQVIRLPFILRSSYPHEILHNWWGNSVYVEWATGNWCEGLTAYLADHLLAEDGGRGAEYRLDTLKKYRAYVREGHDFPLVGVPLAPQRRDRGGRLRQGADALPHAAPAHGRRPLPGARSRASTATSSGSRRPSTTSRRFSPRWRAKTSSRSSPPGSTAPARPRSPCRSNARGRSSA